MNSRGLIWDFPICRGSKKIPVIQHLMENMEAEETLWRPWSSLVSQSVSLSDKRRVPKPKVYVEACRNNVPLKGQGIANIVKCSLWLLQHRVGTKTWLCFVDNKNEMEANVSSYYSNNWAAVLLGDVFGNMTMLFLFVVTSLTEIIKSLLWYRTR